MRRDQFVNQEFEYFTIETNPLMDGEVIDLRDDTVAIVRNRGNVVTFNQLDIFAKSESDYHSVTMEAQAIIDLAEYLKSLK